MKHNKILILLAALLLLVSACTGKQNNSFDPSGKTFYNTVEEFGNNDHSRVWFGKDGSFVLRDNYPGGTYEYNGKWSLNSDVLTLTVSDGSDAKILFEVKDADNLIMKTTLVGSRSDQIFSTLETKGPTTSSAPAPTSGTSPTPTPSSTSSTSPTPTPASTTDPMAGFTYTNYYNLSQGGKEPSNVEIRSDGSFTFIERGTYVNEYNGTYTRTGDTIYLNYINGKTVEFLVKNGKEMILQNDVGSCATGDIFSWEYHYTEPASIPCTGLSSPYTYFWAMSGTAPWKLNVTVTPANTTDKLYYKSEDESVVKIDENGYVSALNPGTTKIHITCGSQSLTLGFETRSKGATDVYFKTGAFKGYPSATIQLEPVVVPSTAPQKVYYKSDDPSIAKVDSNGKVTCVDIGAVKIYATTENGLSTYANIYVEGEKVTIEMENNVSVKAGSYQTIPVKAFHYSYYDMHLNAEDIHHEIEFHTAYTSALDYWGGNVRAIGAVYDTVDIPVYFTWSDGSSLSVTSDTFYVHVEK